MVFKSDSWDDHELVHFVCDRETGLKAIIAVHNSTLGPGCGGCRMWPYASSADALEDVLRLSRAMSYKNALAGLPLGGAKAVIVADSRRDKTPRLMGAFGRSVDALGGQYIAAEDVGVTVDDMKWVARETRFVSGVSADHGGGGDPSPHTARGVLKGIKAAVGAAYGNEDLRGLRVMVQGVGHVGHHLCRELHKAGAKLLVADIHPGNVERAVSEFGAIEVSTDAVFQQEVDVYAPCALGAVINDQTLPVLKARVVAGAANNQLQGPEHGELLRDRGIVLAPDYVINAGGIIKIFAEMAGQDMQWVDAKINAIYDTTRAILLDAAKTGRAANAVADEMAKRLLDSAAMPEASAL